MRIETGILVGLLICNIFIVLAYLIINTLKKREMNYWTKGIIMLLCPIVGPIFIFLGWIFFRLLFRKPVDLADVVFSKERVQTYMKADEESERNLVPLEEALAISDRGSLRTLMFNVVKGDVHKSLSAISAALNSEDSEASHYAASVLQDQLNDFRVRVQKSYQEIKKGGKHRMENGLMLIESMDEILRQHVFAEAEQQSMVQIMEDVCAILYEENKLQIPADYYEAVCLRLLECRLFDKCELWCDRSMEQYPEELSSYTCRLKLYFTKGEKEKFFEALAQLKQSTILIDRETLELIRTFS